MKGGGERQGGESYAAVAESASDWTPLDTGAALEFDEILTPRKGWNHPLFYFSNCASFETVSCQETIVEKGRKWHFPTL